MVVKNNLKETTRKTDKVPMKKLIIVLCFLSLNVMAQPKPQAVIFNPSISEKDAKPFADQGFQVVIPKEEKSELPPVWKRNSLLQRSGLLGHVRKFDELGMDLLYLDAKDKEISDLLKKYSSLPEKKLLEFRKLVKND